MFDLHITCTKDIKTLTLVFDDNEAISVPSVVNTVDKPKKTGDNILTERIKPKKANTVKLAPHVLTPEVIDVSNRPIKVASELNNLEI